MAKKYHVTLTLEEQRMLEGLIRTRSAKAMEVQRAYVLLAADENGHKRWTDEQIKTSYGLGLRTIERLRARFVEQGLPAAIQRKKREVHKEKLFDGEVEAKLIALRCSPAPQGYRQWTLRLLADKMVELEYVEQISYESVRQILKKHDKALANQIVGDSQS